MKSPHLSMNEPVNDLQNLLGVGLDHHLGLTSHLPFVEHFRVISGHKLGSMDCSMTTLNENSRIITRGYSMTTLNHNSTLITRVTA